ncbi:FAR1 DNA binding domain, FHY3/FAR1 family [Artemisia annua]|uniref:FAR1 DNA binding domain, FHY3/FAR1 family n=1 Tax=Artemisia annua TaxID=35608 RepID=A0A2U1MAX5_ARTAN|nr:FAR1 DNA binding domain, FHY3/FAR1 family [Artemisia annua]
MATEMQMQTRLIEDIDTNRYLVDHQNAEYDCERPNYDEVNDDDIWEKLNEDRYAFLHGFGIRIHWDYKNKTTNEVYRKLYVCNKEGFKRQKCNSSNEVSKKRRRDVRTGCKAELRISKTKDGKWCADIFNDTHNHDLTRTPTKVMKHRSHNKFHRSMACKSLMVELGKSGLRPCQVRKAVNAMKSPNEPNVTSKQCADILAEERKQYKGKEFYSLIKHFQEKAAPFRVRYSDFQESFKQWIKSDTVEEFESQWEVLRDKYNLETSSWMMEMYNQRKFWVATFFKDIFLAGMTTSGRSESIHSFFDGFVNSKTMLNEFVIQFDKAVDTRRAAEEDEDFQTINSTPILSSVHPIEAKAGACYTKKIFEVFQKEWIEATKNLTHETKSKSEEKSSYWVGQVNVDKKYWRVVNFCFLDKLDLTCSCAMFETYGILYKVGNASIGIEETNCENEVSALALWYVQANCTKAIEQARNEPSEIKRLNNFLVEFLEDQMIRKKPTETENACKDARVGISQVDMMPQITVRDPVVLTNTKGRPRNATRVKPPIEAKQKKTKLY